MPPCCVQRPAGRHEQLGDPPQLAGTSAQNGDGGVHGSGVQAGSGVLPVQKDARVQPAGHWPPSGAGWQIKAPPWQFGTTQIWPDAQKPPPHATPGCPPCPA